MALGQIPYDKIEEYGLRVGLEGDMLDHFEVIVRRMDTAYLGWQDEQSEKKRRQRGAQPGSTK